MALNYKSLFRKYAMSEQDFNSLYQNVYYKTVQRVGKGDTSTDYVFKYFHDSLEELDIDYADIEKICNHYIFDLVKEEDLEEEAQTSGGLSASIGQRRGKNPKFSVVTLYK
jgi:hypothetical protein